jgi:hypothetical protein
MRWWSSLLALAALTIANAGEQRLPHIVFLLVDE